MDERHSKRITSAKDIEELVNLKEEDITTTLVVDYFGQFETGQRFRPYDIVTIPAGAYGPEKKKNKNAFNTTVGLWIFNKYFIEPHLFDIFGYINSTINKKMVGKINAKISEAVLEDRLPLESLKDFMMKTQKCMPYISILAPNYTNKMLTCTKVINKKKAELLEKYKDELAAGNELVADKVDKELLQYAVDYMGDDPSMDMFISGARGSIPNNFKNMFVMKGLIRDPDPNAKQKYKVASSNYIDGISPDEYSLFANSLAAGPYSRSKKTENGGYREKLFLRAYQHLVLDPAGSDCGTKRYITIKLTDDNIKEWMYSYIIDGNQLVELTSENKSKYIGKSVKMRFSAMCESHTGICNKCMGNLYYRLGKTNVGTSLTQIASIQKNIAMSAFHDSTQQLYTMDLEEVFQVK
jgi:hypothetical protein